MTEPVPIFDGKAYCRALTTLPGVYRMFDARGEVLYVGKAGNLRKRVGHYFRPPEQLDPKVRAMAQQIARVDVTITRTEGEALLLESNLIKELKPRYNIVLRDDKSYPYVHLTAAEFPRLAFHRGSRSEPGRYFGPYPNAGAVRASLNQLQKLFQLRSCEDSVFKNRSRPCLQYQIKRCTAPCVGYIDAEGYRADVDQAVLFLDGRSQEAIDVLVARMERAAAALEFETAARLRDRIRDLQRVASHQYMTGERGDVDVVAAVTGADLGCIQVFYIRNGLNLGNRSFFPAHAAQASAAELLSAFVAQYYLAGSAERSVPAEIILSHELPDEGLLTETLSARAGRRVQLSPRVRGDRARWLELALDNAKLALESRVAAASGQAKRLAALADLLEREAPLTRIECFDVSHTRGEATVASCVVFDGDGPVKSDYRRFNITDVEPGDDYGAMRQVVARRYARVRREEGRLPDLILIDGGKGQVAAANAALAELQLEDLTVIGVAKGSSRRPGLETLVLEDELTTFRLAPDAPALHLIQQIRDEAHRFAITGHRQRRGRARTESPLEAVPGVGAKRRRALIRHFGGLQGLTRAGIEDLCKVDGVSRALAERIYATLHAS